jgi:methyl-accepting chemotaxis protein
MVFSVIRQSYGAKLGVGYVATGALLIAVGVLTQDAASTVIAGIAGLLTLGSLNAAETVASVTELSAQTQRVADGNLDTEIVSTRTDEFGDLADSIERMRVSLRDRLAEMEAARENLEQARADANEAQAEAEAAEEEARELASAYQEIATEYGTVMADAADGDLTQRVDVATEYDAMETVGQSFNRMMDELQETIETVTAVSERITTETDEITETSQQVQQEVDTAVETVAQIREQATDQQTKL